MYFMHFSGRCKHNDKKKFNAKISKKKIRDNQQTNNLKYDILNKLTTLN